MQERRTSETHSPLTEIPTPNILIHSGKTKDILSTEDVNIVRVVNRDDITAGDGARHDVIEGKGILATTTTVNVFKFLNANGIATHFREQDAPDSFLASSCTMIPVECVARGVATGSYLQRYPNFKGGYEFHQPKFEMFIKKDDMNDPFMEVLPDGTVNLHDAHKEFGTRTVGSLSIVDLGLTQNDIEFMNEQTRKVYQLLRSEWSKQEIEMQDIKIEFGRDHNGKIIIADVIDNDSWRLLKDGRHLDKQAYRNNEPLEVVKANYEEVAERTIQFVNP